jgi:glycosyltransferase involved in cell wall biosynthesis
MKILVFANKMPDLCGAFLHDIDLATELTARGHMVVFLAIQIPPAGVNGDTYRGFRFLHYTAASSFLDSSDLWICPHAPILPKVREINGRGYDRPIVATCHYDGNYTMITRNSSNRWSEMLMFINSIMEPNYRKSISPWPAQIARTEVIRPILHRNQIVIPEAFEGDCITLINANENKGVHQFLELAKRMPDRKFLGVRPYYGNMTTPLPLGGNIEWIPFSDDIRTILRRTRILLVPSYYESFGRVAVEAMINGIPVLYSKPAKTSPYPGGSTEGMQSWIGDAAMACDRDRPEEWMSAIDSLDDEESYRNWSDKSKAHIESMNLFSEATRIAGLVESFAKEHPVVHTRSSQSQSQSQAKGQPQQLRLMPKEPLGPVGFGFSNGRLRIQR